MYYILHNIIITKLFQAYLCIFQQNNSEIADITKIGAVSVLSIRLPSPARGIPALTAASASLKDKPPSGPMKNETDPLVTPRKSSGSGLVSLPS